MVFKAGIFQSIRVSLIKPNGNYVCMWHQILTRIQTISELCVKWESTDKFNTMRATQIKTSWWRGTVCFREGGEIPWIEMPSKTTGYQQATDTSMTTEYLTQWANEIIQLLSPQSPMTDWKNNVKPLYCSGGITNKWIIYAKIFYYQQFNKIGTNGHITYDWYIYRKWLCTYLRWYGHEEWTKKEVDIWYKLPK